MSYSRAGEPLILNIEYLDIIECSLIMSTLNPEDISFCEECLENTEMDLVIAAINEDNNFEAIRNVASSESMINLEDNINIVSNLRISPKATETSTFNSGKSLHQQCTENLYSDDLNMSDDEEMILLEAASQCEENLFQKENQSKSYTSDIISINNTKRKKEYEKKDKSQELEQQNLQTAKDDDVILQSPQLVKRRKFVRQIFGRCFDKTFVSKDTIPGDTNCYIIDSDDNED